MPGSSRPPPGAQNLRWESSTARMRTDVPVLVRDANPATSSTEGGANANNTTVVRMISTPLGASIARRILEGGSHGPRMAVLARHGRDYLSGHRPRRSLPAQPEPGSHNQETPRSRLRGWDRKIPLNSHQGVAGHPAIGFEDSILFPRRRTVRARVTIVRKILKIGSGLSILRIALPCSYAVRRFNLHRNQVLLTGDQPGNINGGRNIPRVRSGQSPGRNDRIGQAGDGCGYFGTKLRSD